MVRKKQEEMKTEKAQNEGSFQNQLMREINDLRLQVFETRKDIQSAVVPKFLDISTQLKDLIELSIEIWRLENKINKIFTNISEAQRESITNSIQKVKRYLGKNDIEILDYTDKKFNDGINLEILAVEKDLSIKEPIIKETKEPTIMYRGQVVKKGKVIILTNEDKSVTEVPK